MAAFGLLLVCGGVAATLAGEGADNLIVSAGGIMFLVIGADMTWAHVVVTEDGLHVRRLWRVRRYARDVIERIEIGDAVGMMVSGQRTIVLQYQAQPIPINVLARYAGPNTEQVLRQQRRAIVSILGGPAPA